MREQLSTKHVYNGRVWVHIVSVEPVPERVADALLYGDEVLCAQYALRVPRYIQLGTEDQNGLETEAGILLVRYPDLLSLDDTFLLSNEAYSEFSKFHAAPEAYKGLDAVLTHYHRHWGLVCGVVFPDKVGRQYEYGKAAAGTVSSPAENKSQGSMEAEPH